jgi:U32 family peptidase
MSVKKQIEITSPAGSYEALSAAIQAGAKSVYFGVGKLNMRSQSAYNFTVDDLPQIAAICKENNIKSYLAVNTVIYNNDIAVMQQTIKDAKDNGVDAVILSDFAAIQYAHQIKMPVHLSTQMNISNIEAVKFLAPYADVMVLARELNIDQVKEIAQTIEKEQIKGQSGELVRLELFVHGALCVSISGKCYLSLHEADKSANRGECLQICRRKYIVKEKDTGEELEIDNEYILSPKDLCTIEFIDKIIEAGVTVFKIEGRARGPEYVKIVTQCYHEAVDSYFNKSYTTEKIQQWKQQLETVFNRGFWNGYYLGQKLGEWNDVYGSKATKKKIYIGKVTNFFTKLNVAEILIETGELKLNDTILIIGPTTGVIEHQITEIRVDLLPVEVATKGTRCSIPAPSLLRRSDKVYLWG